MKRTIKSAISYIMTLALALTLLPGITVTAKAADAGKINTEFNGSYTIELLEGDNSTQLGSMEFGKHPQLWELNLPAGHGGDVTLRLTKNADGLSFADSLLIDGIAPKASTAYIEKKLAQTDLDVIEIKDDGLELTFSGVTAGQISLTALIEPEIIPGIPFYFDARAYKGEIKSVSGLYKMDNPGSIVIDGVPDVLDPNESFGIYETRPDSGHPDGNAWIWLAHDENYLYAATEWGADNTYDYGKDFFKVLVETPDGIKEFTQWSDRGDYGKYAFAYTGLLPYEHMCYEMKIPLSELGDYSEGVKLGFSLYGTSTGPSIFDNADTDWYYDDTAADTFYIGTADELVGLSLLVRDNIELFAGKTIELTDDINLGVSPYKDNIGWIAIGYSTYPFKGTFDGDSHIIRGLTMVGDYKSGLFGAVDGGSVENLGVTDVKITGSGDYIGGVAGKVTVGGSITNCYTTGEISGNYIGGVAGEVSGGGRVENCYSTVEVSGFSGIGGVAGRVAGSGSEIANCYARGAVSGTEYAGGVAGSVNDSAVVANCYAAGDVSGGDSVGGITGAVYDGYMEYCYSTGEVSGSNLVGGIAGEVEGYDSSVVYCAALNPSVEAADAHAGRVAGFKDYNELFGNFARDDMTNGSGVDFSGDNAHDDLGGEDMGYNDALEPDFWTYTLGWSDTDWDLVQGKLPLLAGLGGQNLIDIAAASVTLSPTSYTYDGKAKTPAVTVKIGSTILTKNTDYTAAYANNINIGTATVTVTGKGGYTGTKTATFTIKSASGGGSSSGGGGGGSATPTITSETTVPVELNSQTVNATLGSDGTLTLTYTEADIEKHSDDTGEFTISTAKQENVVLNIPISALGGDALVVQTDFGTITISNETLQALRELYGDTLRLVIVKGSFKIALLDDNKKEVAYSDSANPFTVTLPYTLQNGQKAGAVVAVGRNGEHLPFGVYADGSVTLKITATGTYDVKYNEKNFTDINGHWAADNIGFVTAREIFSGTGGGQFSPSVSMTRAMFTQVLANLDGVNTAGGETWYSKAVQWAKANGISDGTNPNTEITREQMAVMLYNYMKYKGYTIPSGTASAFADESSISSWATDAVTAMQKTGIVGGKPGNMYDPQGMATRAEVATVFANFVEYIADKNI